MRQRRAIVIPTLSIKCLRSYKSWLITVSIDLRLFKATGLTNARFLSGITMSKAFLASVLQDSLDCTGVAADRAADDLIHAIVTNLKKEGGFTLPSFGTFRVTKTKARKALNPRTGEPVKVKAGKTVRFKASPNLKKAV